MLTEDDDTEKNSIEENGRTKRESFENNESSDSEDSGDERDIPATLKKSTTHVAFMSQTQSQNHMPSSSQTQPQGPTGIVSVAAKDLVRTVEILNGQDDVGVQDFIRSVKRAKARCSQPELLLDFIVTERIVGNAKRAIRYAIINNYDDLYDVLKTKFKHGSICRAMSRKIREL